jgi:hypothetical protein
MRNSLATEKNPAIADWSGDYQKKNNMQFFAAALAALAENGAGNDGLMAIGLLGQRDIPGVTLRNAQSVLRWDLRPSLWSHAFLIAEPIGEKFDKKTRILEVPLHARDGSFPRPEDNAVHETELGVYENPRLDANVALLAVEMKKEEAELVATRARDYNVDRLRYNFWDTLGIWQSYLWASGGRQNPLREAIPIFSSAYIEMAFEAIQFDITPGASERNSAPEHIWNAALWWHGPMQEMYKREIRGFCVLRDEGCSLLSADDPLYEKRERKASASRK